jgi:rubrerythrin
MKRSLVVLAILLLGAVPFKVRNVLEKALLNEREAIARYELFAQKALDDGYPGAASLFRAAARAENVHAQRFAAALEERGIPVPETPAFHPVAGTTAENLRSAANAETQERDSMYLEGLNAASEARDDGVVKIFDQTRDTEVEHANLLSAAARQLDSFKQPRHYYVCDKCGYTTDVELPLCALCRVNKHPREVE